MVHMSHKLTIMMHISFSMAKLKPSTHLRMVSNWTPLELNKMRILEVP